MSDNINDLFEDTNYFSDDDYEKRRAARQARVEAEKKRQLLYRKLFLAGVGVILVVVILIVVIVRTAVAGKKHKQEKVDTNTTTEVNANDVGQISETEDDNNSSEPEVDNSVVYNTNGKERLFELQASDYQYTSGNALGITYPDLYSQYAIILNATDHKVIASVQGNVRMYPASMTKVMTVLTAIQYIPDSELDNLVEITQEASDYAYSNGCATVNYGVGAKVPIRDLFYGTILKSGADAAYMLAVYVAGSHEAFVELMNENCIALGISETTHFTNCVGVHNNDNYTTCYDMAIIMDAAMKNPFLQDVLNLRQYTTAATLDYPEGVKISNLFLRRIEDFETYGYVCAAKTGFVNQSGNCAASYMQGNDGKDYICVTGHGNSPWQEVYDHIALYNIYAGNNTAYSGAVKK